MIGVCLDFENEEIGFIINNKYYNLGSKLLKKDTNWYPCFFCSRPSEEYVLNFGTNSFKYSIPKEYRPLVDIKFLL
ncbi:hypothetical protein G8V03_12235 [Clostridium botulinum D/C]|nr:hypothetical protein [Clostridium botulinum D/C]MCD3360700.1 hypothetical protein [Clostridium botulinum D/C]MCD3362126.1 hypothetical protein [Clostridium botulinum D/C]MCD3366478.1 hypothetical protein [Clostridium botulinum D/C]